MMKRLVELGGIAMLVLAPVQFASAQTCYTYCAGFLEYACESGTYVGGCFGAWGCDAGIGGHACDSLESNDAPLGAACSSNSQCASGKCEEDECVCRKDSQCPSGKCKTPIFKQNYCD